MGFISPIGPLHQRTSDCPNIVLNEECHNLTRAPISFPLGTESDAENRTVHL